MLHVKRKNRMSSNLRGIDFTVLIPFFMVSFLMLVLYAILGYAPFGTNSLATFDANIQYLDFFAYFKDVLAGKNDIAYTFSKTLGGSNIAVFSYYLSSPLNLLVIFFDKADLHIFFNLLVAIKLSIAALTFSFFLKKRFALSGIKNISTNAIVILLSLGYSFSQYSIAQSSNIMWLDGVYILPLMMVSVYELVTNKTTWKLALTTGLAIIFNWYSAGINCLFVIVYFFFELVLNEVQNGDKKSVKEYLKIGFGKTIEFGIAMATGVLLSAVVFLPTTIALMNIRGGFDISLLTDVSFIGRVPNVIQNYVLGAKSSVGSVSLYCGVFALLGCISCFWSSKISKRIKVVFFVFLSFTVLIFYWKPLCFVFSLLKNVNSFWYRYSYLGIVVILFFAAYYYFSKEKSNDYMLPLKTGGIFAVLILILDYVNSTQDIKCTYFTALLFVVISALLSFMLYIKNNPSLVSLKLKRGVKVLIFALCVFELVFNAKILMNIYHASDVQTYQNYVADGQKQIDEIKTADNGIYRISQTSTRNSKESFKITANLNESAGFNYFSISGYTSATDDIQNNFMDRMGYRTNGLACIVNSPVIGIDSLLGVKYVLSEQPIEGLVKQENFTNYNKKDVYENPYSLPFAFTYNSSIESIDETLSPFEYQNEIYSQLFGEKVNLYTPVNYDIVQDKNEENIGTVTYKLNVPSGNNVLYGNLPMAKSYSNANLNVNDVYETGCSSWMSPSVFYIPVYDKDADTAEVEISSETPYDESKDDAQFYALNVDKLAEVTKAISENEVKFTKFENGNVELSFTSDKQQRLYLSIPYDKGWHIEVNGKEVEPELFADCMMTLPLEKGEYNISLKYEVRGLKLGIGATCLGVAALIGLYVYDKKIRSRKKEEV